MNAPLSSLPSSSVDRPLGLRSRCDLLQSPSAGGGVIVSDLVASIHHELTHEEAALLDELSEETNQPTTLRSLQKSYEQQFAPRRIRYEELASRIGKLHEAGLLIAEKLGQGEVLWQRQQKRTANQRRWAWAQLLSIRLPGLNPQPILDLFGFIGRFAFSRLGALLAVTLWSIALLVLMSSASRFAGELPHLAEACSPIWIASLLVGIAILKSLHELGHALSCHRYGAEVREMGILLLMFMPCLYSDVTGSWRLSSRWQRMVITSAGVFVEMTIAAIAVLIWRFSEPGLVHTLALQMILIASISTLLVNLNPLMRYDGYYLLSDLTETPNLWTRSRQAVSDFSTGWFIKQSSPPTQSEPLWIFGYGVLSQLYLYSILAGFAWLLLAVCQALRIEVLAWSLIALILAGMLMPMLLKSFKWLSRPRREQPIRKWRAAFFLGTVATLGGLVMQIPLPDRIGVSAVVVPTGPNLVAATLAGRLIEVVPRGTKVQAGDLIAKLESPELLRQRLIIESELAACELELRLIEAQRTEDSSIAAQLPTAKARLESCQRRLDEMLAEMELLNLRASRPGIVMLPPQQSQNESNLSERDGEQLPRWTGQLLSDSKRNPHQGAWIEVGDVLAMVADRDAWALDLMVSDTETKRLAKGQSVRVALRQQRHGVLTCKVTEIGRQSDFHQDFESNKASFVASWLPNENETFRKVRVELSEQPTANGQPSFVVGGLGEARIDTGWQTLGEQLFNLLAKTFRLPY